eukprot:5851961-Pleurochrysis_carterae.AAC.4
MAVTLATHILVIPAALATAGLLVSLRLQIVLYLTYVFVNISRGVLASAAAIRTSRALLRSLDSSVRAVQVRLLDAIP